MSPAALALQQERTAVVKLKRVVLVAVVLGSLLILAIAVLFGHHSWQWGQQAFGRPGRRFRDGKAS